MRRVVTNSKTKPTPASRFRVHTPPNEGVVNLNTDDVEFRGRVDFTNAEVIGIDSGVPDTYTLPSTDGDAGQVLQTDGSGVVTWEDPASGASYLSYTALLVFSGSSNPTATIISNGLSGPIVWTRTITGRYVGTLVGAFTSNKTACFNSYSSDPDSFGVPPFLLGMYRASNDAVEIRVIDNATSFADVNGTFTVEIRVYP